MKTKKIRLKHSEFDFIINTEISLEKNLPSIGKIKISLPKKAHKGEKLLLKLVQIYCYDVLCTNLTNYIQNSKEYKNAITKLKI